MALVREVEGTAAMECKDLGILEGSVLLFGGAYSNLQALNAMLAMVTKLQIPLGNVVHTGDVVAYCAQPRETTELLKDSGVHCLMGNCEESIGVGKEDCGCGFPEDSACNAYSVNWYAHVTKELVENPHLATWMGRLPRRIEFTIAGRRLAVVHGSPRHISEFIWPSAPDSQLRECFEHLSENIDGVIGGHSGIPFARLVSIGTRRRLWLNAGVVGMPANDGTPRGWFALLTPKLDGGIDVSTHELPYDTTAAADAIFARPQLVRGYADSLVSGVWPSHDILPVEEAMATGMPICESSLHWPAAVDDESNGIVSRHARDDTISRGAPIFIGIVTAISLALAIGVAWSHRARGKHKLV